MTSQPAGLPLPFPVPSKVSWRHKQAGGTSMVSSSPLAHPTGSGANTPPQALTRARTAHSAHVHPFNTHSPRQITKPRSQVPAGVLPRLYIKLSPRNRLPHAPQADDCPALSACLPVPSLQMSGYPTHQQPSNLGSSVKTLRLVDFTTRSVSRTGRARLATISIHPSSWRLWL